jgi:hypothetical protein
VKTDTCAAANFHRLTAAVCILPVYIVSV